MIGLRLAFSITLFLGGLLSPVAAEAQQAARHGVRPPPPSGSFRLLTPTDSGSIDAPWQERYPRCAKLDRAGPGLRTGVMLPTLSRRLTSLPRVTAAMAPVLLTTSTGSGSGLFYTDAGWIPTRAPSPTGAIGGHFVNSSASGPMPTSRYWDHIPLLTSTSLTLAASGEPGRMPRRSGPMIA